MSFVAPRLILITPVLADVEAFKPALTEALASGDVASLLLRLGAADERTLINRVKALAPIAQAQEVAVVLDLVGAHGFAHDAAQIATRGGADGVHVEDREELRVLRERYRDSHIIGAGRLETKHDAMQAGEFGADYVLFGEPDEAGAPPALDALLERAHWWAEIFETPCVVIAPTLAAIPEVAETGVEFVALGDPIWTHAAGPRAAMAEALSILEQTEETLP
jgi:thiamine-phosphate pyrophosphorylase